jgi:hypothetical protein
MRSSAAGAVLLALAWLAPSPVTAHPANVAHAQISIAPNTVDIALSMNVFELDLLLSLDRNLDGRVDGGELQARRTDVGDYLRRKVGVSASGASLPAELLSLELGRSGDGRAVVEAKLAFRAARPLRDVVVQCEPLTELGADHTTLARIRVEGRSREFVFRAGVTYRGTAGALATAAEFLQLGIVHIFIGYDHIAFLVGLLLGGGSILAVAKIVTAFTAAHSITLSLAALDVVTLDPLLVEIGIALSIVYVAAENLFTRAPARRWLVSFVFGLVHGFGFAAVLKELALPASALAASLVSFNVGVEVAQVAIIVVMVPALYWLRRTPMHLPLRRATAAVILSLGLFWLYQRTLS